MKTAVLGYNIFAVGGTTRSNINLLKIFSQHGKTTYYNYVSFDSHDVDLLTQKNSFLKGICFASFDSLFKVTQLDFDVIFVTREDFFPIAKLLRFLAPHALIIGEIHTPLALLGKLKGLCYFSCLRVATPSIKKEFIKRYKFKRLYVQTVSLNHLKWQPPDLTLTTNFVIQSRFCEKQKDILYSLRLFNELHEKGYHNFYLYIKGEGHDKAVYQDYIKKHRLTKQIKFVSKLPFHYIYLSTSNFETLGYSIIEAVAAGHQVIAYKGKDNVIYENLKDVPAITWLEKQSLEQDTCKLITVTHQILNPQKFNESRAVIIDLAGNYFEFFKKSVRVFKKQKFTSFTLSPEQRNEIKQELEQKLGKLNPSFLKKIYYKMLKCPLFNKIFKSSWIQKLKRNLN